MINFKSISLSDKNWMDEVFHNLDLRSAEYCFASTFLWGGSCDMQIANVDGCFTGRRVCHGDVLYNWPVGKEEVGNIVYEMAEIAKKEGYGLKFYGPKALIEPGVEKYFSGKYTLREERQWFDYVYLAEKMASLQGKKLHGKRNHINKFIAENENWSVELITDENLGEVREMCNNWFIQSEAERDIDFSIEKGILNRVFDNYKILGFEGAALRSNGRVIGFTMGEKLCKDTFITHFEKAYSDVQGAYPMINREFSKIIMSRNPEIVYINREDDLGLENLRKAKLSYYPEMLVEKCTAIITL